MARPSVGIPLDALSSGPIPRHRHHDAYVAVVLDGRYDETGDSGRFSVREGDLLFHRAYESHANLIGRGGARVLNLAVPGTLSLPSAFRVRDLDSLMGACRRGEFDALQALLAPSDTIPAASADWPDLLARALDADPSLRLDAWARAAQLHPATVSRGFRRVFGVSPARFRVEARVRKALSALRSQKDSLAAVADAAGFADQAHLTRAAKHLTGRTPAQLRSNRFKTGA